MEIRRGWRRSPRPAVVTIGNYDGVHRGHQAILAQARQAAQQARVATVVVTFEPMPQEYFAPARAPARLTRLREKAARLAACGIDELRVLRFDRELAAQSAERFVRRLLVDALSAQHVVVGDDFRFGRGRTGDIHALRALGLRHGFSVAGSTTIAADGERISSTRIRQLLAAGELPAAARLLGGPYTICGRVMPGQRLGRQLGYPTANLSLRRRRAPLRGIYVVEVAGLGPMPLPAVASLGTRPTVNGRDELLEVHLLEGEHALYGKLLKVRFLHFLRPEAHFADLPTLKRQIGQDAEAARAWFEARRFQDDP